MDKGPGSSKVDKRLGGGRRRWIKKILNVNIMNCKKLDKLRGGAEWKRFLFVKFSHFLMFLALFFFYIFCSIRPISYYNNEEEKKKWVNRRRKN